MTDNNDQFKKVIIWQKWVDPFGQNSDDVDWPDYDKNNPTFEDSNNFSDDTIEAEDNTEIPKPELKAQFIQAIKTPMGIIPMNEHTSCTKIFNFWLGHTNFNISKSVASSIEDTDGVETLDIFTRYRFRIAIGKAFKDASVMKTIQDKLCEQ